MKELVNKVEYEEKRFGLWKKLLLKQVFIKSRYKK
jgi:hypothetical protein